MIFHRLARKWISWLTAALLAVSFAVLAAPRFEFVAFGNFKRMIHSGDTGGCVKLDALPQTAGNWGVGALAGLKGEVLLHDGRLLVSRGDDLQGRTSPPIPDEEAALFAAARVRRWADVKLPGDMSQTQFEAFVLKEAAALGLDAAGPFPFLVEGRYPRLAWHVVTGEPAPGPAHGGAGSGHSAKRLFDEPNSTGRLVGLYSGADLEGVVTHPGERFHVHFAESSLGRSGHVDAYAVAGGGVLKLPLQ